jgi:hypothetical protein
MGYDRNGGLLRGGVDRSPCLQTPSTETTENRMLNPSLRSCWQHNPLPKAALLLLAVGGVFAPAHVSQGAEAAVLGLINVKNLSATDPQQTASAIGNGKADDTAAIQAAADLAKKRTVAFKADGGAYLGTSPAIYFPAGRYLISDEILLGSYTNIVSDSRAIIEQASPEKRCFVFNDAYTISVRGMKFVGGRNHIWIDNKNIDSTMLDISECEFQASGDYAIVTQGTSRPNDQHMSANLMINRCKFMKPRKVLRNVCDYAMVRDCWVTIHMDNFDRDSAAFLNTAGTLMFDNMIGVPVFGSIDPTGRQTLDNKGVDRVRWIDNHGSFLAKNSRFGGEFGGIPIVHHFGLPDTKYPKMGQTVCIENSWICAGPRSRNDSAVITLRDGIPLLLRITGNSHLIEGDMLLMDGPNLPAFLRANPDLRTRIHFELESNMTLPPGPPSVPAELRPFLSRSAFPARP